MLLTELKEWQLLAEHQQALEHQHMRDWFIANPSRYTHFSLKIDEISLDYSRNRINAHTLKLLADLATVCDLNKHISALFAGSALNTTENRPALHTALRHHQQDPFWINGTNITADIANTQRKMRDFVAKIHREEWRGSTGKPINAIVNIGIGGSFSGPRMCISALKDFSIARLAFHFISSIDKTHLTEVLQSIDPEKTLFIISSKSFATLETFTNTRTILNWLTEKLGNDILKHHVIAITANMEKAILFGIPQENIFPLWDWVGGRYSIWSAIGLPLMLMIGEKQFDDFLSGAHVMDQHFKNAAFVENMPVILALLGIWYTNFFGATVKAIIPYSHRLRYLIPYLQQAEMESNGKSVSLHGVPIQHATSPVIIGEEGIVGQHSYHQLLHQGKHFIPADFILVHQYEDDHHQDIVIASALSQAQALMQGKTHMEAYHELLASNHSEHKAHELAKHISMPGNKPVNIISLNRLTPKNLGALIALYEHKIFVQGIIWGINSFDQWGVELGKQLLPSILKKLQSTKNKSIDALAFLHKVYLTNEN